MEILDIREVLQVIELVFESTVHHLYIAVITPGSWRNAFVFCSKTFDDSFKAVTSSILPEASDELRAIVGLELCPFKIEATVSEVFAQKPNE
jgi:hypothetical protein